MYYIYILHTTTHICIYTCTDYYISKLYHNLSSLGACSLKVTVMEDNADIAIGDITEEVENQQSSSSACSYFVMKALSMDSLEEMRDRKCFDALNPILHTKILEHLRERDVTLIVTVNGSRSFQAHAKVNREECLSKVFHTEIILYREIAHVSYTILTRKK